MYVNNGTGELKRVLLSRPTFLKPAPINEIAKKWEKTTLDTYKMEKEHRMLVEAYESNGVKVEFLEADEKRPNAVFARDFGACVKEGYILGKFKYELRKFEHIDYENRMKELGIPLIAECKAGLFEGGDFMFLGGKHLVFGLADRTDAEGLDDLREQLEPYGYDIIGAPLKPEYLHLDMCFNLVDENLAVAYWDGMPDEIKNIVKALDIEIISIEEDAIFEHGCNLQAIGKKRVISLSKNSSVNKKLEKKGMTVIDLDIHEILKAGGGPHCMTFPLERI